MDVRKNKRFFDKNITRKEYKKKENENEREDRTEEKLIKKNDMMDYKFENFCQQEMLFLHSLMAKPSWHLPAQS